MSLSSSKKGILWNTLAETIFTIIVLVLVLILMVALYNAFFVDDADSSTKSGYEELGRLIRLMEEEKVGPEQDTILSVTKEYAIIGFNYGYSVPTSDCSSYGEKAPTQFPPKACAVGDACLCILKEKDGYYSKEIECTDNFDASTTFEGPNDCTFSFITGSDAPQVVSVAKTAGKVTIVARPQIDPREDPELILQEEIDTVKRSIDFLKNWLALPSENKVFNSFEDPLIAISLDDLIVEVENYNFEAAQKHVATLQPFIERAASESVVDYDGRLETIQGALERGEYVMELNDIEPKEEPLYDLKPTSLEDLRDLSQQYRTDPEKEELILSYKYYNKDKYFVITAEDEDNTLRFSYVSLDVAYCDILDQGNCIPKGSDEADDLDEFASIGEGTIKVADLGSTY